VAKNRVWYSCDHHSKGGMKKLKMQSLHTQEMEMVAAHQEED
jgi:hypothetical protein